MGGFSKIFDAVANTETLDASMWSLQAGGVLSVVGIGKDVMTDLTPLWMKLQTLKGVYSYGYTDIQGKRRHIFEIAIDYVKQRRVQLEPLVTHTFVIEDYRKMIEINLNKKKHRAVKTAVCFT